ncbi:hypothetical protein BCR36DRAFT_359524 [Piromyces finnis]|uniref:Mitochondrial distribution and morphology protein 12 n=1 Tax=Piromyces finnis TaxID=1754191 RepID=A0A1Y1V0S0_9FUNG|nr:hypothetical protein BCR36DRAFT_359524 [Piromyces finnis]|eukprot:ORX44736.1 hypothetical protein BCR36DRAFT_359524 [Piromyces finnis]
MSFEIFWDKLDVDIALSFQNYLNDYFKKIKRPDFLGEVVFSDADFGQIPPEITIIDICDPMSEFYDEQLLDNDYLNGQDNYNYDDELEKSNDYFRQQINDKLPPRHDEWSSNFNRLSFNGFGNTFNNQNFYRTSSLQNLNQNFNALSLSDITSNFNENLTDNSDTNNLNNNNPENKTSDKSKVFLGDISFDFNNLTPFLTKSVISSQDSQLNNNAENNESITSINNNISSNTTSTNYQTIADFLRNANESSIEDEEDVSSMDNAASATNADVESITSSNHTHGELDDENSSSQYYNNDTLSVPSQQNSTSPSQKPLNLDIQVELDVVYRGNLKLTVSTALILNKPTPAFMTLPIKLALKGISFKGIAVIAYIGNQINFCFKEPEESESLIEDIRLESELGDENKQVLKNISKIEGFLISKIKSSIDELLIFPNYHSIYISKDEN